LEIIQDIDRQIIGTTDQNLTENLRLILIKGLEFIGAENGQIFRYDEKTKTLVEKVATTETYTKEPKPVEGVFEHVVSSKKSVLIEELKTWEPAARMNSRLTVPLITGDLVVGIFNADSPRLRAFSQRHQEILEALAPQATIAIQNAYLFRRVNHRASLLQVASEVSSNAISIRNLDDLLATTVKTIVEKFGYHHAAIFLIDEEEQEWAVLRTGTGEAVIKLLADGYRLRVGSDTPVGQVTGPFRKSCFVSYVDQERLHLKNPYLPETRSEIALPLSVKAGKKYEVLGALNVHSTEETVFPKRDKALLQAMADQLAVIINNNVLYRQSEVEQQLVKVLRAIDRRIINPDDTKTDILNFILAESCRLTSAEGGQIFLIEGDNELKVEIATDKRDRNAKVQTVVGTVIGDAIFRGQILVTDLKKLLPHEKNNFEQSNDESVDYTQAYKINKRSRAAVRFYEEDSNIVGVLSVEHSEPGQFTSAHVEILLALAGQAAITIKNRALIQQAEVRNRQLEATAQVGADIISSLDVEELLKKTVELIRQKFNLYYAGIFLIEKVEQKEPRQRVARLKATSSVDEHQLLNGDYQFEVGGKSMVGYTTSTGRAKITQVNLGGGNGAARSNNLTLPETLSKMTLPLRNRKGVIGALEVQSVETIFTENDTQTLQTMADQLATAIYNAELYQQIEQDKQQLAALRDIDRAIISTELNLDETLKLILTRGLDLIEAKHGSLSLLEPDQEHLIVFISSQKKEIGSVLPVNKSILGLAVEKRRSIRIPDISLEPRYQTDYNLFSGTQITSTLLVPLKEDGVITGVFSAYSTQTNAFSKKQQETLETMAGQAAIAINNASLYSQAQRRAALLKAAAKVSQSVISVLDLDQLLDKIVNTICDEFEDRDFHYAAVFLVDETDKYARQRAGTGKIGRKMVAAGFKFKLGLDKSIVNAVIQSGRGIIEEYNFYPDDRPGTLRLLPDTQSEMALPLKLGHNVIGALTVHSRQKDAFTDEDTQTLQSMADQLAIAIDNVKKQEKLVEAESLKSIAEATSQSMHWVANQTAPIQYWVNKIEETVEPIVRSKDIDELIQEDFFEGIGIIRENVNRILEVKTGIMGTAREFKSVQARLEDIIEKILRNLDFPPNCIEQSIAPQLPLVQVDPTAIEEVLRNLFVNAIQAMEDIKSPKLQIKVQYTEPGKFVKVNVTDNGIGISDDKIRDIWKPFYTTKAGRGGTGVGLSYCLQAMHKMAGEISVESRIGQGTTFTLEIPTYQD
jgi:GAF domain-containing protein/anti-sigma regulatory factor (Ser/Thr protein kinase)